MNDGRAGPLARFEKKLILGVLFLISPAMILSPRMFAVIARMFAVIF